MYTNNDSAERPFRWGHRKGKLAISQMDRIEGNPPTNRMVIIAVLLVGAMILGVEESAIQAQERDGTVVRIAELVIDPAQLNAYKAAVKEEMDDAIRLEPGVLAIYSVAEKDKPNSLRFFEIYASEEAYRAHIESPHFKKYVATTQPMILSRKLIETVPVQLSAQPR